MMVVMNDNARRGPEWRRLVAEFFVPRLGGDRTAWETANRDVFEDLFKNFVDPGPGDMDYVSWIEEYQKRWLRGMAEAAGVQFSSDDAYCLKLSYEATAYVTRRVHAEYPGAVEAVHSLHNYGFQLFTASNELSGELNGYLTGMGVRQYFGTLYGSDILNQGKYSTEYYRRMFEHAGVDSENSLVVDDNQQNLAWASALGAATCLVGASAQQTGRPTFTVSSLSELPAALVKTV